MRLIALLLVFLGGCKPIAVPNLSKSPEVSVIDGKVSVTGDAKIAPKVNSNETDSVLTIPEGSNFVFNERLGTLSLLIAKSTNLSLKRKETAIEGAVAFDPPKQPTVKEQAEAKSAFWSDLGLKACVAIGGAAALFGLVRGWDMVMYGGVSIAGAGLFGIFIEKHPLLLTFVGLGVAAAVVGPYLWHTKLKNLPNAT